MKKVLVIIFIYALSMFSVWAQGNFNPGDEQGLEIGKLDLPQDSIAVYEAVNGWWAESRKTLEKRMDWYTEARFGCFIHWGPYSLPGGEWDGTPVRGYAEHLMRIRKIPLKDYKEKVVKPFNPVEFDADEWMRHARDAGMRYFIITAKHHDGFAMFHSDAYPYDMRMTGFKRDPMKELRDAAKKYNIKFGFYYSHAFDWEHPDAPGNDWDYDNPGGDKLLHGANWWLNYPQFLPNVAKYVNEKSIPQVQELIRNYQPDIMWFDTPHKLPLYENVRILKAIRDLSPDAIVVNGRLAGFSGGNLGDYINTGDRAAHFFPVRDKYWEAIPTTNESYGYSKFDLSHKSPAHFIQLLASATAKGGNILMNVGPMGNGKWDEIDVKIFRGVGDWLKVNGESIYGNDKTGLPIQNWGVTTRKGDRIYLHIYQWPKDGKLVVGGLSADVAKAYFIANKNAVICEKLGDKDMLLRLPAVCPDTVNTVVALQLRNVNYKTDDRRLLVTGEKNILYAFDAQLSRGLSTGDGKQYRNYVQNWTRADQSLKWNVRLSQPATYRISVNYNKGNNNDAGTIIVEINDKPYKANYAATQRAANSENLFVAAVDLTPGEHTIVLKGERYEGREYMRPMELVLDVESKWVSITPDGKLIYKTTPKGDRIMDFSSAGYMGGGVAFPNVPVKKTVRPLGGGVDDVPAIQAAIDAVAAMPLENGFRGAVLLEPGIYNCKSAIRISVSGIVLRGSGSEGRNASVLLMNDEGRYPAVNINPGEAQRNARGDASNNVRTVFKDDYVPSGANSFNVASVEGFAVGDIIHIIRPTTAEWVKFMGMHDMVRGGAQTWIGLDRKSIHIRRIAAINGNNITLDAPLSDSYDAQYLGKGSIEVVRVAAAEPVMPLSQIGVERLRIQCQPRETDYGNAPYSGVRINGQDVWVDDLQCVETMNTIPIVGRRITIRNVHVTLSNTNLGASKPADFSIEGSQILIDRCSSDAGNTYWVWTNSYNTGPNVVLNSNFAGRGSRIQPHQRWATGLLVDNCHTPDGGIDFSNRGVAGSGHGWCMGWGVAWNCTAATFIIQNPPGAPNWAIGCIGERQQTARYFEVEPVLSEGIFESHGTRVAPRSLYLAQLAARLGSQAVAAIGYAPGTPAALALEKPVMLTPRPQPKTPVDSEFGENLAFLRPVNLNGPFRASDTADPRKYSGEKALDGNPATYWMPGEPRSSNRGPSNPNFEIDSEGPLVINALVISEPAGITNVRSYRIEGLGGTEYTLLAEGTTIGARKVHTFPKTTVWKVRLTILNSEGTPAISELSLHCK